MIKLSSAAGRFRVKIWFGPIKIMNNHFRLSKEIPIALEFHRTGAELEWNSKIAGPAKIC